jgi:hypothetical protein
MNACSTFHSAHTSRRPFANRREPFLHLRQSLRSSQEQHAKQAVAVNSQSSGAEGLAFFGSNLGPLTAEYHAKSGYSTQNKPKRDNRLVHQLLVRDQGVGGSNPLSPTILCSHIRRPSRSNLIRVRQIPKLTPLMISPAAVRGEAIRCEQTL